MMNSPTLDKVDRPFSRLHLQVQKLLLIESDVQAGEIERDLAKGYQHLRSIQGLLQDLDEDSALWVKRHEDDLNEQDASCDPDALPAAAKPCPSAPIKETAELLEASVREQINKHSRPVSILDLPDELLTNIFYLFSQSSIASFRDGRDNVKQIKDLRLTCWRFCNVSSCFLICTQIVDMTPDSLSRLDQISRHPTISQGVLEVRAILDVYVSPLARSIETFAQYHASELESLTQLKQIEYDNDDTDISDAASLNAIEKGHEIAEAWADFSSGGLDYLGTPYLTTLHKSHEEYRRRFDAQELLRGGPFADAVGAAFSRMPKARTLTVWDMRTEGGEQSYLRKGQPSYMNVVHDFECLAESMVFPMRWEDAREYDFEHPFIEELVRLPAAIQKAGTSLTVLDINVSCPPNLELFAANKKDLDDLNNAMQNLKIFDFRLRNETNKGNHAIWPPRRADEIQALGHFLTQVLDTSSLEDLNLDLHFLQNHENLNLSFSFISLIEKRTMQKWKKLAFLDLRGVSVHLEDLAQLAEHVLTPQVVVDFYDILLLSGTWASGLDILRGRTGPGTYFIGLRGGEYDHFLFDTEKIDNESVSFGQGSKCSKIEAYLRGIVDENPFKVINA